MNNRGLASIVDMVGEKPSEGERKRRVSWICGDCGVTVAHMSVRNEVDFFILNRMNSRGRGPSCRCGCPASLFYDPNDFPVEHASVMNEDFDLSEDAEFTDEFLEENR
tara:strand:- start:2564 stop:2887 length:324 start_codon:yes stop_codon:yes gene_type:complete